MTALALRTRLALLLSLMLCAAAGAGCDDGGSADESDTEDTTLDTSAPDTTPGDTTTPDATGDDDTVTSTCETAAVAGTWVLDLADDVSVSYSAGLEPQLAASLSRVVLLFERYQEGEDVGTFELGGTGPDGNFGTCAHCVYVSGEGPERAFFADRGTLVVESDPYGRRLDASVTGLRLIEVDVDMFTRQSTPVPGGRCIEIADFEVAGVFPDPGWTCEAERYNDGTACDCECGTFDPDCGVDTECPPFDPSCTPEEPLPVAGCAEGEFCAFEPVSGGTVCTAPCTWGGMAEACDAGTCVFDDGSEQRDRCIEDPMRFDPAAIGEACGTSFLQLFCAVESGFAMGYCDPNGTCRAVCESDAECTEPDHTCRKFFDPEGYGYCGPEPVDG